MFQMPGSKPKPPARQGGFTKAFTSAPQVITSAGALVLGHGLGVSPSLMQLRLKAINAVAGYSVGDEAVIDTNGPATLANRGMSVVPDATNLNLRFGADASAFAVINKATGVGVNITNTDWSLIVRAWA